MSTTTNPATGTWTIDPAATTVTVTAKKLLGIITVPGTLTVTSGTVVVDDDHRVTDIRIELDAASYDSGNPKRDTHVASDDFLDAESHPTLVFTADSTTGTGDGARCNGTVTVKGQTSPVELVVGDVEVDGTAATFTASTTLDRKRIGVDKLPGFVIKPNLQVEITARATLG